MRSLDDGTLTLTVYLTDTAGNQGNNVVATVFKDMTAPTAGNSGTLSTSEIGSTSCDGELDKSNRHSECASRPRISVILLRKQ